MDSIAWSLMVLVLWSQWLGSRKKCVVVVILVHVGGFVLEGVAVLLLIWSHITNYFGISNGRSLSFVLVTPNPTRLRMQFLGATVADM